MSSPISRDYARRPELAGKLTHVQWMKRPPFQALQRIWKRKESEFKKPYLEDEHVSMEHFPQYPWPWMPDWPFPNFPDPVPDDPDSPWYPGEPEEEVPGVTVCPGFVMCGPGNPTTIAQSGTVLVNILSCPPPAILNVKIHESNFFKIVSVTHIGGTDIWAVKVRAEADACGPCHIIATDPGGGARGGPWSTTCTLLCDTGVWTKVGNCRATGKLTCYVAGGCPNGSPFNYVIGNHKWAFYEDTQCLKSAATSIWEEYPGSGYDCAGHEPPSPYDTPYLACGGQEPCAERDGVSCYFHMRFAYHYTWGCA